jgi:hypothetical protein
MTWTLRLGAINFLLALAWMQITAINAGSPITVCQALDNLDKYRGKIVEIRGEWNGADLRDQCAPLKTGTYTWATRIWLTLPGQVVNAPNPKWQYDKQAFDKALKILQSSQTGTRRATVVGRFDSWATLEVFSKDLPGPTPGGFGHLGEYPAQLVIYAVKDVTIGD